MRGVRPALLIILLAVAFTWSILRVFGVQFSAGGFYPAYSSLRADARGTKLLFDALNRMPGLRVTRNYLPLEYFKGSQTAVFLLGIPLNELTPPLLDTAERMARQGNRVVIALAFRSSDRKTERRPVEEAWHIRLAVDPEPARPHPLSFINTGEWKIREQAANKTLAIERPFGEGTVLLFAESSGFSNENLVAGRLTPAIAALGPDRRVTFDEQHFGIAESGSVVGLARRFRLGGLAIGLAIVLGLSLWKNSSAFPPPGETRLADHHTGRTSFEGLVTLLQRHVRPQELLQACWEEWLKSNRHQTTPDRIQGAAEAVAKGAPNPIEGMRQLHSGLHAKGEL